MNAPQPADGAARNRVGLWPARPLASFHLVVTIAVLLTVLGLVMVLSSSSVEPSPRTTQSAAPRDQTPRRARRPARTTTDSRDGRTGERGNRR